MKMGPSRGQAGSGLLMALYVSLLTHIFPVRLLRLHLECSRSLFLFNEIFGNREYFLFYIKCPKTLIVLGLFCNTRER